LEYGAAKPDINVPPFYGILLPLFSAEFSQPLLHGEIRRIIFRIPKNYLCKGLQAGKDLIAGLFVLPPLKRNCHRQNKECNFKEQLAERKEIGGM
jgi:hypothetical protein